MAPAPVALKKLRERALARDGDLPLGLLLCHLTMNLKQSLMSYWMNCWNLLESYLDSPFGGSVGAGARAAVPAGICRCDCPTGCALVVPEGGAGG